MVLFKELPQKYTLGLYYPAYFEDGSPTNPNFENSGHSLAIYDLKYKYSESIDYFEKILNGIIDDESDVSLIVPPTSSGIKSLVQQLAESKPNIIDATDCWLEKKRIDSRKRRLITNKNILLIDDVVTTGNTMNSCGKALLEAEPKELKYMTLSRTISDDTGMDSAYRILEENYPKLETNLIYYIEREKFHSDTHSLLEESKNKGRNDYEYRSKILDEIETMEKQFENNLSCECYGLWFYFEKAKEVVYGNDTFSYDNYFQSCFLW